MRVHAGAAAELSELADAVESDDRAARRGGAPPRRGGRRPPQPRRVDLARPAHAARGAAADAGGDRGRGRRRRRPATATWPRCTPTSARSGPWSTTCSSCRGSRPATSTGRSGRSSCPSSWMRRSRRCASRPRRRAWPSRPSSSRFRARRAPIPERLQRVLFNLIQNAIRHTPADGSVTVRAEPAGEWVEIEVADTGSGIPLEDRERLFDPFVRGAAGDDRGRPRRARARALPRDRRGARRTDLAGRQRGRHARALRNPDVRLPWDALSGCVR